MTELEVQRTLVKSPPELWSELSDVATLARVLDEQFGEVEITCTTPETSLTWRGPDAEGTVELAASGWGTRVRLTAQLPARVARDHAEAALQSLLDEVGTAHHRPFSRP